MPVRAVCKPHSPDLKRGALATDARGCSLWRSLLERPPPAPESRVRDPLGELVRTRVGGLHIAGHTVFPRNSKDFQVSFSPFALNITSFFLERIGITVVP